MGDTINLATLARDSALLLGDTSEPETVETSHHDSDSKIKSSTVHVCCTDQLTRQYSDPIQLQETSTARVCCIPPDLSAVLIPLQPQILWIYNRCIKSDKKIITFSLSTRRKKYQKDMTTWATVNKVPFQILFRFQIPISDYDV